MCYIQYLYVRPGHKNFCNLSSDFPKDYFRPSLLQPHQSQPPPPYTHTKKTLHHHHHQDFRTVESELTINLKFLDTMPKVKTLPLFNNSRGNSSSF